MGAGGLGEVPEGDVGLDRQCLGQLVLIDEIQRAHHGAHKGPGLGVGLDVKTVIQPLLADQTISREPGAQ